jgi:hypothetical protein
MITMTAEEKNVRGGGVTWWPHPKKMDK